MMMEMILMSWKRSTDAFDGVVEVPTTQFVHYSDDFDEEGFTPLHRLVSGKANSNETAHVCCLYALVQMKANPLALVQSTGENALHLACKNTSLLQTNQLLSIVECLIDLGLEPNSADLHRLTPLILASMNADWEVCKLLLTAGGDLNLTCDKPIKQLVSGRQSDILKEKSNFLYTDFYEDYECSANDLIPAKMREELYAYIKDEQTRVPLENIRHCSECGTYLTDLFESKSKSYSILRIFSRQQDDVERSVEQLFQRKTSCSHCGRVVCMLCCTSSNANDSSTSDLSFSEVDDWADKVCPPCSRALSKI